MMQFGIVQVPRRCYCHYPKHYKFGENRRTNRHAPLSIGLPQGFWVNCGERGRTSLFWWSVALPRQWSLWGKCAVASGEGKLLLVGGALTLLAVASFGFKGKPSAEYRCFGICNLRVFTFCIELSRVCNWFCSAFSFSFRLLRFNPSSCSPSPSATSYRIVTMKGIKITQYVKVSRARNSRLANLNVVSPF